jgi:protein-disulfide isomerase
VKQVFIGVLAIVAIIGGAVVFGKDKEVIGSATNHVYGKPDSQVTVVEFGDFECPACAAYFPIVSEIKEKYKDKIAFQFRHLPLVQGHQNALAAHRAAEAAARQGKFWEMHDLLYQNQEDWNGPSNRDPVGIGTDQAIIRFEGYASSLGLNMDQYKADLLLPEIAANINFDAAEAKSKYSAVGTPTFIVNGKKVEDIATINTVEAFSKLIDETLGVSSQNSTTESIQAQ